MEPKKVLTSTADFSRTVLSAQTPDVRPDDFTKSDFLKALKKVSRKDGDPPAPDEEKPKES